MLLYHVWDERRAGWLAAPKRLILNKVVKEKNWRSLPISTLCDTTMLKSVFLDPNRAGELKGFDLVDEISIRLIADTTRSGTSKTGVKVWRVYKPDVNGIIIGLEKQSATN